ncbi:DEAD/DEAH box helicase [Glycomyces sp. TRM65418]|uniref:ATP-dependent DNA helicase n=1 Tax=Glycomyces sp. TRM65418 TaxID=2867006 RepID=UPI001CE51A7F|nr:UvrD-helicase domain-containing protein [Glycomyces sp. TRM65418]MCC3765700.1 DEAD/DEAH box helicase [Glycomyces sp. TRM65418]QZD55294.1 DEAD/DEAH box helicase [Glycomyces sp. TRM65418]
MSEHFSAVGLANRLGQPTPTGEQQAVIEAGRDPMLVVAGAGSGKTTTMADRVVWLIANRVARPEHILGLTFTRKAAAELAARVRDKLRRLTESIPELSELHGEPTVSTYNAYAGSLVGEHGLRIGVEPSTRVITDTGRWQLARDLVCAWDGEMSEFDVSVDRVTELVLQLAEQLAEHLRDGADLRRFDRDLHEMLEERRSAKLNDEFRSLLSLRRKRDQLLPLVEAWDRRKRELGVMDFADQLSLAAQLVAGAPEIVRTERDRWRVVLLDEYQDTSFSQVALLRDLFGSGHPVTAVGDPNQSIYSWRGASAGTLQRFPSDFPTGAGGPAHVAYLTRSWRNREAVLDVANAVSEPLRAGTVPPLTVGAKFDDEHGEGLVEATMHLTAADEAEWIAARLKAVWDPEREETAAVLIRKRRQIPALHRALTAAELPVQVIGSLGLLYYPEVAETVAMLRAAADPTNGPALMRLLAGNRWRIGPRDIAALWARARELAPDSRGFEPDAGVEAEASLADALADPGAAEHYSTLGYLRFAQLHEELSWIRSRLGQSLPDVVGDVIAHSGLDVEVMLHHGDLSNLDEFTDIAAAYENDTSGASVPGFLSYLESAAKRERGLVVEGANPAGGVVQLMTVHAAKGLEWDVVSVPGLCEGILPTSVKRDSTWVSDAARLPYGLRGDAENLPVLYLDEAYTPAEVKKAVAAFKADDREAKLDEERRLAYVALTRARRALLASGYWWDAEARSSRKPAPYLEEARNAGARVPVWAEPGRSNPLEDQARTAEWPSKAPLGSRQAAFAEAADLVLAVGDAVAEGPLARQWREEAELLLAERDERESGVVRLPRPTRLSTSQLMAMRADEEAFAAQRRRPMPQPPREATQRGTEFHSWVEEFFGGSTLFDPADLPGAADEAAPDTDLDRLKAAFRNSEWSRRRIAAQEVPFVIEYEGTIVRGRIDAVFHREGGGYDIVDWKTGRPPEGEAAEHAALQLKVYRKAWAKLKDIDETAIRTAFHYVGADHTWWPELD